MSEQEARQLREAVLSGMSITFEKLVEEKKKNDSEFAFVSNGDVILVKAAEM